MNIFTFTKKTGMGELYLVPNLLSEGEWQQVLPARIFTVVTGTRYFIVENLRTTRRFLKQVNREINIDELVFFELNKHTLPGDVAGFMKPLEEGNNMAVVSEAGCPGVADPGADVVKLAHEKGYRVVPLVGPSSILLALMASGMNGQNFAFNGYLPVNSHERTRAIALLEKKAISEKQTQIFIETPYRNNAMVADILKTCSPATPLCIAAGITGQEEMIATKPVGQWKKRIPDLNKTPVVFLIGS
jgi:16S rRNA (cytidine1402-2'-O)-methyltransferase